MKKFVCLFMLLLFFCGTAGAGQVSPNNDVSFSTVTSDAYYITAQTTFPTNAPAIYAFLYNTAMWDRIYSNSSLQASHSETRIGDNETEQYEFLGDDLDNYLTANASGAAFWSIGDGGSISASNSFTVDSDMLTWSNDNMTNATYFKLIWDNDVTNYTIDWSKEVNIYLTLTIPTLGRKWDGVNGVPSTLIAVRDAETDFIELKMTRDTDGSVRALAVTYRENNANATTYLKQLTAGDIDVGSETVIHFRIGIDETWEINQDGVAIATNETVGIDLATYQPHALTGSTSPDDWTDPMFEVWLYSGQVAVESQEDILIKSLRIVQ